MPQVTKKEKVVRITLVMANLLVLSLIIIFVAGMLKDTDKNPINTFFQKVFSGGKETPNTDSTENNAGTGNSNTGSSGAGGSGTGSGGGSGGGSGNSNPEGFAIAPNCILSQISYSLENFKENSFCNEYDGNLCIKKTINCSIEIHNGDQDHSGIFKIMVSFMDSESNNVFDSQTQDFMINTNEFEIFGVEKIFESTGENGQANKAIKCVYNTVQVPQKEVCS